MSRGSISRWLRVAGAATLVIAFAPLTAGSASASIGTSEDDRRVTICHRTNSDTNPYVVISPSKMSIVKEKGHDSHEGPVYGPTLKDQKIMWGDIIPPFNYYASEKDRRAGGPVQSYPGSDNFEEGGAEIYANECQVPEEPESQTPTGEISVPCVPAGGAVIVRGSAADGGEDEVTYQLLTTTGGTETTMPVTDAALQGAAGVTVTGATIGSEIELQFKIGREDFVTLDGPETAVACDAPGGSYTVICAQSGTSAQITVGTLDDGGDTGSRFVLAVTTTTTGTTDETVTSGEVVNDVPLAADLELSFVTSQGAERVLQTEPGAPAVCQTQEVVPSGSFTTECTATAAQGDIGALDEGTFRNGTYRLVAANGFSVTVTSNQQNVPLPASTTVTLEYAASGQATAARTIDSEQSPAACPERGDVGKTSVPSSGSVVPAGSSIDYTVTVRNTGTVQLTDRKVVDTLPSLVTVQGTPSDSGVVSSDGRTITWTATLAPGASKTFTYTGLVSTDAPAGQELVNTVTFLDQRDTTTHTVALRALQNVAETPAVVAGVKVDQPAPTGSPGSPDGDDTTETVVQGTKTGPGVLAATGSAIPLAGLVSLGGMLLLIGAALLRATVRAPRA